MSTKAEKKVSVLAKTQVRPNATGNLSRSQLDKLANTFAENVVLFSRLGPRLERVSLSVGSGILRVLCLHGQTIFTVDVVQPDILCLCHGKRGTATHPLFLSPDCHDGSPMTIAYHGGKGLITICCATCGRYATTLSVQQEREKGTEVAA